MSSLETPAFCSSTRNTSSRNYNLCPQSTSINYQLIYVGNGCTGGLTNELITVARSLTGNYILGYTTSNRSELINSGWHLVTVTYDSSTVKIYIDGVLKPVSVGSGSNTGKYGNMTGTVDLSIGSSIISSVRSSYFSGQIDDVQIYNYALSAQQVKLLYNQNSATRFGPVTGSP